VTKLTLDEAKAALEAKGVAGDENVKKQLDIVRPRRGAKK
jgi:hypothetical protein